MSDRFGSAAAIGTDRDGFDGSDPSVSLTHFLDRNCEWTATIVAYRGEGRAYPTRFLDARALLGLAMYAGRSRRENPRAMAVVRSIIARIVPDRALRADLEIERMTTLLNRTLEGCRRLNAKTQADKARLESLLRSATAEVGRLRAEREDERVVQALSAAERDDADRRIAIEAAVTQEALATATELLQMREFDIKAEIAAHAATRQSWQEVRRHLEERIHGRGTASPNRKKTH